MLWILFSALKLYFFAQKVYISVDSLKSLYRFLNVRGRKILYLLIKRGLVIITETIQMLVEPDNQFTLITDSETVETVFYSSPDVHKG